MSSSIMATSSRQARSDQRRNGRLVRGAALLALILATAIFARMEAINFPVAIAAGITAMTALFPFLFGPQRGFGEIPAYKFIPTRRWLIKSLLSSSEGRLLVFVWTWWLAGALAGLATYKILNMLLIKP